MPKEIPREGVKLSTSKKLFSTEDIKFLFNELRKASVIWSGRKEVLALARKKVLVRRTKDGKAVYKYFWRCAKCSHWFRNQSDMEVDHIKEVGGISEFTHNWEETIHRLFPRPVEEHLQVLCAVCHSRKTAAYLSAKARYKRKKVTS